MKDPVRFGFRVISIFWSLVDRDSPRCPGEVPTCGSVCSCTDQGPICGTLVPNQQDTHMCVQVTNTPRSTQTPVAWHLGTSGLREQGWPRAAWAIFLWPAVPHTAPLMQSKKFVDGPVAPGRHRVLVEVRSPRCLLKADFLALLRNFYNLEATGSASLPHGDVVVCVFFYW